MKYSKQYLDVTKSEFPCWFIGKNAILIFFLNGGVAIFIQFDTKSVID